MKDDNQKSFYSQEPCLNLDLYDIRNADAVLKEVKEVLAEPHFEGTNSGVPMVAFTQYQVSLLKSLVYEAQVYTRRLEQHLRDHEEFKWLERKAERLKKEIEEMEEKVVNTNLRKVTMDL